MELSLNTTALHHATSMIRPRNKNYSWSWKAVNINLQIILKNSDKILRILTSLGCNINSYCFWGCNAVYYSSFSILVSCKSCVCSPVPLHVTTQPHISVIRLVYYFIQTVLGYEQSRLLSPGKYCARTVHQRP